MLGEVGRCTALGVGHVPTASAACAVGGAWRSKTVFSAPDKPEFVRRAGSWLLRTHLFCRHGTAQDQRRSSRPQSASRRARGSDPEAVDRWSRSIANAASGVDRFYVYDNSVDDRDAELVPRAADGRVVKEYGQVPAWAEPILERLNLHES
ncbi:MAG TPA: hypothetical protein VFK05_29605 [Polyangiaceae bacterium]|nr:hypothetical protein [Polyangiaceae bacterium]